MPESYVGSAVGNVCAINTEGVLRTARTVDRDVDGVCLTGWISGAYRPGQQGRSKLLSQSNELTQLRLFNESSRT